MSGELDDVWSYQGLRKSVQKRAPTDNGTVLSCQVAGNKLFKKNALETTGAIVQQHLKQSSSFSNIFTITDDYDDPPKTKKQASLLSFISRTVSATATNQTSAKNCSMLEDSIGEKSATRSVVATRAVVGENSGRRRKTFPYEKFFNNEKSSSRKCPFYKYASDSPYVVDAFSYGCVENVQGYFLSHFHADHYTGLTGRFAQPIYCSEITANLVKLVLNVASQHLHILPLNRFVPLPDGTRVLLTDANHCPGAVMFLFHLKNGRYVLHTGDLRADKDSVTSLDLWKSVKIDILYLDTTYCNMKYVFPRQCEIVAKTLQFVSEELHARPNVLICVGAYTIGKERIFVAIASMLDCKIFVQQKKYNILKCLNDDSLKNRLTLDPSETNLHIVSMDMLNYGRLLQYAVKLNGACESILAIKPTGWEFQQSNITSKNETIIRISRRQNVTIAGVPYSEHSSCDELKEFVQAIRPFRILPTVNNGNANERNRMQTLFDSWLKERA